jgi:metallophosphoesterase (TIGR03768 family)
MQKRAQKKKYSNRKHATAIKIFVGIAIFVIAVAIFCGWMYKKTQPIRYPISSNVYTTVDQTVVPYPYPLPTNYPKIAPYDLGNYAAYGYGQWRPGPGVPYQKRLDLMSSTYSGNSVVRDPQQLLNFFVMTDIHITDKQSPSQAITLYNQGGIYSVYSGVMLYTTQVLDAAVQTINALHKEKLFDFGISLGDAINSTQHNELRWYIDVLDGKRINPNSGIGRDHLPDYQEPFQAAGLDTSIPWYQTLGNHDHFWMGFLPPDDYIRNITKGDNILDLGNPFINPEGVNSRGYYMGSLDGRTKYGNIIGSGKDTDFKTTPTIPSANPDRYSLTPSEWMNEFFNTTSNPKGHGFSQKNVADGFASYSFVPKPGIKVIVLDDTQSNDDPNDPIALGFGAGSYGYGHGELDDKRYKWLVKQLDEGRDANQLMIIAAHIPIGVVKTPSMMAWNPKFEAKLLAKLHEYPTLLMWVAGHRHFNTVTALTSPKPDHPEYGFWEVETASLRDFPQQFRTIQIVRNADNTVSIFVTDVDPAVPLLSPAWTSRSYAIGAYQIFKKEAPQAVPDIPYLPSGAYNAELVKQLTPKL